MRVANAAVERFGGITGLINNAGVAMRLVSEQFEANPPPFWQIGAEAWRAIMDTNVCGVFYMSRCTIPIDAEAPQRPADQRVVEPEDDAPRRLVALWRFESCR